MGMLEKERGNEHAKKVLFYDFDQYVGSIKSIIKKTSNPVFILNFVVENAYSPALDLVVREFLDENKDNELYTNLKKKFRFSDRFVCGCGLSRKFV